MIRPIYSNCFYMIKERNINSISKKNVSKSQNTNYQKSQLSECPISFYGTSFHPINSKRELKNYGDDLYIGAKGPSSDNRQYSVYRDKADAHFVDLQRKDLSNYSFEKSSFYKADLTEANLENTTFENSNMWGVWLKGAKTKNTNFRHVNFCDADLSGADFGRRTDMMGANLIGADLSNTDLTYVNLTNALYNQCTILPEGCNPDDEDMILLKDDSDFSLPSVPKNSDDPYETKRKRFEYAKIRYLTIKNANFSNNSLKRADLKGWKTYGCNFQNTILTRVYAKEMDIRNSDFSGAKMKQINFDQAEFKDVNMTNADLRGAIFTYKSASNLKLDGTVYDQYTKFNEGFNPRAYGMKYEYSSPAVYGAKTEEEVRRLINEN